jgi:hypothetical protein
MSTVALPPRKPAPETGCTEDQRVGRRLYLWGFLLERRCLPCRTRLETLLAISGGVLNKSLSKRTRLGLTSLVAYVCALRAFR